MWQCRQYKKQWHTDHCKGYSGKVAISSFLRLHHMHRSVVLVCNKEEGGGGGGGGRIAAVSTLLWPCRAGCVLSSNSHTHVRMYTKKYSVYPMNNVS